MTLAWPLPHMLCPIGVSVYSSGSWGNQQYPPHSIAVRILWAMSRVTQNNSVPGTLWCWGKSSCISVMFFSLIRVLLCVIISLEVHSTVTVSHLLRTYKGPRAMAITIYIWQFGRWKIEKLDQGLKLLINKQNTNNHFYAALLVEFKSVWPKARLLDCVLVVFPAIHPVNT